MQGQHPRDCLVSKESLQWHLLPDDPRSQSAFSNHWRRFSWRHLSEMLSFPYARGAGVSWRQSLPYFPQGRCVTYWGNRKDAADKDKGGLLSGRSAVCWGRHNQDTSGEIPVSSRGCGERHYGTPVRATCCPKQGHQIQELVVIVDTGKSRNWCKNVTVGLLSKIPLRKDTFICEQSVRPDMGYCKAADQYGLWGKGFSDGLVCVHQDLHVLTLCMHAHSSLPGAEKR